MNKNGDWIGTPVTVDRSVNDLVLVDNALSDSMLGPRVTKKKDESHEREKVTNDDNVPEVTEPDNSSKDDDDSTNTTESNDDNKEAEVEEDPAPGIVTNRNDDVKKATVRDDDSKNETGTEIRRSARKRVQRITIEADDIGDCDTENDPDYKA